MFLLILGTNIAAAQANQSNKNGSNSSLQIVMPDIQVNSVERFNNSVSWHNGDDKKTSWIIIIFIVFSGILIYSFDFEPLWIVLILALSVIVYGIRYLGIIYL